MNAAHRFGLRGVCLLIVFVSGWAFAAPVSPKSADRAVVGWLSRYRSPMETQLAATIDTTETVTDADGQTLYYVVQLTPQGFVVVSADDAIEPIIAFSATGRFGRRQNSPLAAILESDMQSRLKQARQSAEDNGQEHKRTPRPSAASAKWQALHDAATDAAAQKDGEMQTLDVLSVNDVRVAPFVQSKWSQADAAGGYCYNYYTPGHYPTGCVATAMAQLMRYHEWPQAGIGQQFFWIQVDGGSYDWSTRGGDGIGGPYDWSQMPYEPHLGLTTEQRQAIGALCLDAGLSVGMSYTLAESSASSWDASDAFKDTFGYANSIYSGGFSSSGDAGLWGMMHPNLDAQLPVILSISGPYGGHAVLADGYGYLDGTLYHHLNMGWGGEDDAWYHLPTIDASYPYNALTSCIYNVFPTGVGEIVSGRVLSMGGAPLAGATVTAYQGATIVAQTQTNARGIYALTNLPSYQQYSFSTVKDGYVFVDQTVWTGGSHYHNSVSGNVWGVDFYATNPAPPIAIDQTLEVHSLSDVCIPLTALDDNLPNPPGQMTYTIRSLPLHGTLSEPGVGTIDSVPHTLSADGNVVCYAPCAYFGGQDSLTFIANDGGAPPSGGDSNVATITINVDNQLYTDYATDTFTYSPYLWDTQSCFAARSQIIYLQSDLGEEKYLTGLALRVYQLPGRTLSNWTIRMQHTNWNTYSNPGSMVLNSGWTIVYQADETISQTGWYYFTFQTPFYYNGSQNLLVDFSYANSGRTGPAGAYFVNPSAGSDRGLMLCSPTGAHGDPLNWTAGSTGGLYYEAVPSVKLVGTVPIEPIPGDFNLSCTVNLPDLAMLAAAWRTQDGDAGYDPACDISTPKDGTIDLLDLLVFAEHWLQRYEP